ncbi:hypothetical protein VPH35_048836 [Triticum aestivum]|uniref:uncharacterized protein n=2 Tax=Triticum TaxID=4564 RepID=UPI001D01DCCF|nr:uncharacterized protein LOC123068260 [Triticum aestivum]
MQQPTGEMEMKKAPLPAPAFHKEYTLPRARHYLDQHYSLRPPLSKDDYSKKDPTSEMEKKKKAPLPTPHFHKERPLPRAERSPDRRYSPYPPPSMDGCSGKNAGSWPLPPIYYGPPSEAFHVDWRNKDGVVDMEHYSTELFAAMDKHSILSVHRCTRPQFGPNVSAEYVLDPIFEDTFLANPRFSYLLPLIGHKVSSAAEAPNSTTQVGTTTGYWQCDGSIEVPVREVAALKISDN